MIETPDEICLKAEATDKITFVTLAWIHLENSLPIRKCKN